MTPHEKWLKERLDGAPNLVPIAAKKALNVWTGWYGFYQLSWHKTNRLNIFNFKNE